MGQSYREAETLVRQVLGDFSPFTLEPLSTGVRISLTLCEPEVNPTKTAREFVLAIEVPTSEDALEYARAWVREYKLRPWRLYTKEECVPLVQRVFVARRDRVVNPQGTFDNNGRWYPSDQEDGEGSGSSSRHPSRAWPYSYMLRCRTREHCSVLVDRGLRGKSVPPDVAAAIADLPVVDLAAEDAQRVA